MSEESEKTIVDFFLEHVEKTPDRVFLTQPMGGDKDNILNLTFAQVLDQAKRIANYLKSLGFEEGSKIALCSKNCAWWVIADLGIWLAGYVSVPVYPTLTAETVTYVLDHSEAKLLFVGKLDVKPWDEMKGGVPEDLPKISLPMCPEGEWGEKWDSIIEKTEPVEEMSLPKYETISTIIYTSGSTGKPKGVMHNFKSLTIPCNGPGGRFNLNASERYLSYLPLSHGMERWVGECCAFMFGYHVFYADSLATFVDDLVRAKPTVFVSVPRLWTKFQLGVHKKMKPKKLAFLMKIPIIGGLVKKKIIRGLGLDHVKYAASGSAPIPKELLEWYHKLGLEIMEGYGMTENFNYSHMSKPKRNKVGYVGECWPGVEHRIAEDGEIQVSSPGMMLGYYKNDEATKATFTEDGWLKTGDRGEISEEGLLKITGRTKEIFKTSKGKYVAPAPIESLLIANEMVELACVGGSGFPQPHAIVQLGEDVKKDVAASEETKASVTEALKKLLAEVNESVDPHEALEFLALVNDEWTPENGFLTPTQKIRRNIIEEAYNGNNETWYDSKEKIIWYGF